MSIRIYPSSISAMIISINPNSTGTVNHFSSRKFLCTIIYSAFRLSTGIIKEFNQSNLYLRCRIFRYSNFFLSDYIFQSNLQLSSDSLFINLISGWTFWSWDVVNYLSVSNLYAIQLCQNAQIYYVHKRVHLYIWAYGFVDSSSSQATFETRRLCSTLSNVCSVYYGTGVCKS